MFTILQKDTCLILLIYFKRSGLIGDRTRVEFVPFVHGYPFILSITCRDLNTGKQKLFLKRTATRSCRIQKSTVHVHSVGIAAAAAAAVAVTALMLLSGNLLISN